MNYPNQNTNANPAQDGINAAKAEKYYQETITVREFAEKGSDRDVYLETAWGYLLVDRIDFWPANPWAHCPKENAGYGMSYMVCPDTMLHFKS